MTRFSIIVPLYKGQKYVTNLIRIAEGNAHSLMLAGIESKVELILVNDSPDTPLGSIQESQNVKIILHRNMQNCGIHQSRVNGLQIASGEFVVFLDQDDQIADDFLVRQFNIIQETQADMVVGNALNEQNEQKSILAYRTKGQFKNIKDIEAYLVSRNQIISPGQCLLKKNSIPMEWSQFILQRNGSDDLFLWLLMLVLNRKIEICKDVIYTHKCTGKNLSVAVDKMTASSLEVGAYLHKISYVPMNIAAGFVKSRQVQYDFLFAGLFGKLRIVLNNPKLFTRRMVIKLRTFF